MRDCTSFGSMGRIRVPSFIAKMPSGSNKLPRFPRRWGETGEFRMSAGMLDVVRYACFGAGAGRFFALRLFLLPAAGAHALEVQPMVQHPETVFLFQPFLKGEKPVVHDFRHRAAADADE